MRHYHVMGGLHGCLPNFNEIAMSKKDAIAQLKWWKEQEIAWDAQDGQYVKVYGNAKDLYYEVEGNMGNNDYYEAVECYDIDCLNEGEY